MPKLGADVLVSQKGLDESATIFMKWSLVFAGASAAINSQFKGMASWWSRWSFLLVLLVFAGQPIFEGLIIFTFKSLKYLGLIRQDAKLVPTVLLSPTLAEVELVVTKEYRAALFKLILSIITM